MAQISEIGDDSSFMDVTRTAEEVGLGFDFVGAPVALSPEVWHECVEWGDQDTEQQTYQEQDARLWDVLFTGGGTLQLKVGRFMKNKIHRYSVQCIPRDGESTWPVTIDLLISPKTIRGQTWLVIEKAELDLDD